MVKPTKVNPKVFKKVDSKLLNQYNGFLKTSIPSKIKEVTEDFLKNSSLHGLKYIADDELSVWERLLFLIVFICLVGLCGYFASNLYMKWTSQPIIIFTNPNPVSIDSIPFPAITICNLNQAQKSEAEKIPKYSLNYSLLQSLCYDSFNMNTPANISVGTYRMFKPVLLKVSQSCDEMLIFCTFARKRNCIRSFDTKLTDDGLCCTFNAIDNKFLQKNYNFEDEVDHYTNDFNSIDMDWSPEFGYSNSHQHPSEYYPRIATRPGESNGLTVILNTSQSEYYCSLEKGYGFKFLVHNPIELPKISNYGRIVSTGTESRITIMPQVKDALPSVRQIDPKIRKCFFSDEGNLTFYRTYSRKNCEVECEAKILLENCHCVLYFHPRLLPDAKICGPYDFNCTTTYLLLIGSYRYSNFSCEECYPGCFEIGYTSIISSIELQNDTSFLSQIDISIKNKVKNMQDFNYKDIVVLKFFYDSRYYRKETVDVIFSFTNFISNVGGIFGLLTGFSVISALEIIYYCIIRPIIIYNRHQDLKEIVENEEPNHLDRYQRVRGEVWAEFQNLENDDIRRCWGKKSSLNRKKFIRKMSFVDEINLKY